MKLPITFYNIKNGKFDLIKIINKMIITTYSSNSVKINEKYFLVGGEKKFILLIY